MGVAHLFQIGNQLGRHLGVCIGVAVLLHLPASHMHLVDVHGRIDGIGFFVGPHPCFIVPLVAFQLIDLAAVGGSRFRMESIGVGLVHLPVIGSNHAVLVYIVFLQAGNKYLPNALFIHFLHGVAAGQPAVEIAHHAHCAGMRRPQPEHHTLFASALEQVCAEELLRLEVVPLKKEIDGISLIRRLFSFHVVLLPPHEGRPAGRGICSAFAAVQRVPRRLKCLVSSVFSALCGAALILYFLFYTFGLYFSRLFCHNLLKKDFSLILFYAVFTTF